MLAFVLDDSPGLKEVPTPEPMPDEALVRVLLAGICGTDLELLAGYRGFRGIPGHEMVGVVERASDPSWIGKRVVSEINLVCHECSMCSEGLERHCQNRRVMGIDSRDGCFAELVATPIENLHAVPESVTDEEAVWTEPLAAALGVWDLGLEPGDRVLVLGDGRLGSLIALGLQWRGAAVEIAGRHEEKLSLLESLGLSVMTGEPRAIYPWVVEAWVVNVLNAPPAKVGLVVSAQHNVVCGTNALALSEQDVVAEVSPAVGEQGAQPSWRQMQPYQRRVDRRSEVSIDEREIDRFPGEQGNVVIVLQRLQRPCDQSVATPRWTK